MMLFDFADDDLAPAGIWLPGLAPPVAQPWLPPEPEPPQPPPAPPRGEAGAPESGRRGFTGVPQVIVPVGRWAPPAATITSDRNSWLYVPLLLDAAGALPPSCAQAWREHP
eukprot:4092339-Heterocapsa_arctica.AAC.1